MNIYDLPDEVILKILRELPHRDLISLSQTSKRFNAISMDPNAWRYESQGVTQGCSEQHSLNLGMPPHIQEVVARYKKLNSHLRKMVYNGEIGMSEAEEKMRFLYDAANFPRANWRNNIRRTCCI
jgi:hypothetical protein